MAFRTIARTVFAVGAVAIVLAFSLRSLQNSSTHDSEFLTATTVVTDENFSDVVLGVKQPVLLDFFGDYCVVCKQLEPELAVLAREHSEDVVFARVNVEDAPGLVERFEVRKVPTLGRIQGERRRACDEVPNAKQTHLH